MATQDVLTQEYEHPGLGVLSAQAHVELSNARLLLPLSVLLHSQQAAPAAQPQLDTTRHIGDCFSTTPTHHHSVNGVPNSLAEAVARLLPVRLAACFNGGEAHVVRQHSSQRSQRLELKANQTQSR